MRILWKLVQQKSWGVLLKAAQGDQDTLKSFVRRVYCDDLHDPIDDVVSFTFSDEDAVSVFSRNNPTIRRSLAESLAHELTIIKSPHELVGIQVTFKLDLAKLARDPRLIEKVTEAGKFDIIKALVEHHHFADPTIFKIYFTSQNRNKVEDQEMLALFLKNGLSPNEGLIALTSESIEKAGEAVKLLLSNNANINWVQVTEIDGRQYKKTSLSAAASNPQNIAMVKLLLDAGADVNIPDVSGVRDPAQYSNKGYTEIADLLRTYTNDFGKALLSKNYDEFIKLLGEKNEDGSPKYNVNAYNGLHNTPLNVAVENEDIKFVRKLFEAGAKLNDDSIYRVKHSKLILKLLIENGADIEQANPSGYFTPLTEAITYGGDADKVDILLACGANPNFSRQIITPLGLLMLNYDQAAYKAIQSIIVPLLLKYGADVDQVFDPEKPNGYSHIDTAEHNTPLKLAYQYAPHMVEVLESHHSNPVGRAIVERKWDDAFALLSEIEDGNNKYDINGTGLSRSPLYFAIKAGGDKELVKRFLNAGAQVDSATLSLVDEDMLSIILSDRKGMETCLNLVDYIDNNIVVEAIQTAKEEQDEIDVGGAIWDLFHL